MMNLLLPLYIQLFLAESVSLSETEMLKSRACYKIITPYLLSNSASLQALYQSSKSTPKAEAYLRVKHDIYLICMRNISQELSHRIIRDFQFFKWESYQSLIQDFSFATYSPATLSVTPEIDELDTLILTEEEKFKTLEKTLNLKAKRPRKPSAKPISTPSDL